MLSIDGLRHTAFANWNSDIVNPGFYVNPCTPDRLPKFPSSRVLLAVTASALPRSYKTLDLMNP